MKLNPQLIQLIGAAIIPVLGFYFWNWNLYFIVLYYILDQLIAEVFVHIMSRNIRNNIGGGESAWLKYGLISGALFLLFLLLIHVDFLLYIPEIDFINQIVNFLTYEEMGLRQWVFLLPLLILVGFQRYKLEFVMRGGHRSFTLEQVWKKHILTNFAILAMTVALLVIIISFSLPEDLYLWLIVILSSTFNLLLDRSTLFKPLRQ